ncbi:MAG TPA: methyl-accepting chemotaxis protein [Candidatus Omnitrophota bacterium]|nr:methyl-accepting chemotaxis protein [Candidatus Omnitrophota bacterium]
MRLSDIRIAYKVGAGFAVVLALLVIVGAVGFSGLSSADADFQAYRGLARDTNAIGRVQANMLQTRIAAKNFLLTGSPVDKAQVQEFAAKTESLIQEMESDLDDASQIQRTREIRSALVRYATDFQKAAVLRSSQDELLDKQLGVAGPEVERALTAAMESAYKDGDSEGAYRIGLAIRDLLLGRLYAQKFLILGEEAFHQRASSQLAATADGVAALGARFNTGKRHDLLMQAKRNLDDYLTAYAELYAAYQSRAKLVTESLDPIGANVAKSVEDFKLGSKAQQDELGPRAAANVHSSKVTIGAASFAALALGVIGAFFIGHGIAGPIKSMTQAMQSLANGNLTVEIPATTHKDEIGAMAGAVQVFKDNANRVEALRREQEQQDARLAAERKAAMNQMADNFESSVMGVVKTVSSSATEMQVTAQSMSAAAQQSSAQATTVAAAAEQASANVQTVASAAEELSSSITEISRQVSEAARVSGLASDEAAATNTMVQALAAAADRISDVVKLINDIASQTNLLALNATIEAARAGDAGKGFAVVANEVKSLANQTGRATEEISGQIAAVQEETRRAVDAIANIAKVIDQVKEISSGIASAVEEQGAATKEIARNVEQAARGTEDVSSNIGGVMESATSTGAAAEQVNTSASDLARNSELLRSEVTNFLATVRAG